MFKSEKESFISNHDRMKRIGVCTSIAAFFSAGFFGLVQYRSFLSLLQFQFFGFFLLIAMVLTFVYGLVGPELYNFVHHVMKTRKENALAKQFNATFSKLFLRFDDIASDNKYNNIRCILKEIRNKNMQLASVCDNNSFDYLFRTFTNSYKSDLKTKYEFILFIKWFESMLTTFNDNVICGPISLANALPNLELPESTMEEYENARASYNSYIDDYCNFVKEVGTRFKDVCLRDHFYLPKQIHRK